jgi:energy-coupling factor transporter ATP-binding protein EcfA2
MEKTILLIGSTGKGKSTLANVLTNTNNFKESQKSVSGTREIQSEEFEFNYADLEKEKLDKLQAKIISEQNNLDEEDRRFFQKILQEYLNNKEKIRYCVIDTVGLGDTKLKREEVLDKIAEAVYLARQGVGQIFFVIDEKFNPQEMSNYDLLKNIIFDDQVIAYTTIIRTRFADFKNKDKRQADIELMIEQGDKLAQIINSCQKRVVYVDNPSLNLVPARNETEARKTVRENKITDRKNTRNDSRKELINHLNQINQNQTALYQPSKLKNLSAELAETFEQKKSLEKKLKDLQEKHSPIPVQANPINTIITTPSVTESASEISEEVIGNSSSRFLKIIGIGESKHSLEKIRQLEDKRKELENQIQAKQQQIRAKVWCHILNNADGINEQLGGQDFLTSVTEDGQD